jgi:hypothetical protein
MTVLVGPDAARHVRLMLSHQWPETSVLLWLETSCMALCLSASLSEYSGLLHFPAWWH